MSPEDTAAPVSPVPWARTAAQGALHPAFYRNAQLKCCAEPCLFFQLLVKQRNAVAAPQAALVMAG